jgi:hypothetical protein
MQKTYGIYSNLGYWFLLLIVLVSVAFYPSYFAVFFDSKPVLIHVHFLLMSIWIAMVICQPFLIKYKKFALHRSLGKASYFIVPLTWITTFLMMRRGYFNIIEDLNSKVVAGSTPMSHDEILGYAASATAIAFVLLFLFILFYLLAIANRRNSTVHSRYMVAAVLPMLSPTVDRIIGNFPGSSILLNISFSTPDFLIFMAPAFLLEDAILFALLVRDYKQKTPIKTLLICLIVFIAAQVFFYTFPSTHAWSSFVTFLMRPDA